MLVVRPEACVFMHASFALCDNLQMRIKTNMCRGLLSKALSPKILCPSWFDTRESKARQQLHFIHSWLPRCWQAISRRNLSSVDPMLLSILGQKRKIYMHISFFCCGMTRVPIRWYWATAASSRCRLSLIKATLLVKSNLCKMFERISRSARSKVVRSCPWCTSSDSRMPQCLLSCWMSTKSWCSVY